MLNYYCTFVLDDHNIFWGDDDHNTSPVYHCNYCLQENHSFCYLYFRELKDNKKSSNSFIGNITN